MTTCFINNEEFDVEFVKEDINLISVNSKTEIFFNVFDCKIKSKNIILEKIETRDNNDIVVLEVLYKGKKYITDAILIQGEKSFIKLNEKNLYLTNDNNVIKKNIEENIEEKKEVISEKNLQEINKINDSKDMSSFLAESLSNYNTKKLNEKLKNYENIYNKKVNDFEDKKKEFLVTIENEFDKSIQNLNEEIDFKIQKYYENTNTSNKALIAVQSKKLKDNISKKYNSFINEINNLKNFNKDTINGILEEKSQDIKDSLNIFLENLNTENRESFSKLLNEKIDSSEKNINSELTELKNTVVNLSNNNILISKNNKNLFKETNKRFNDLNKKIKILSEKRNDEYNELLAAVNNKDVVEYKTILKEKIEEAELSNIKQEILKEVSGNFNNEIISLKRYAEMSSGGGSVAVQYANGGTMNGDLNVNGTMKADTILATTLLSAGTLDIGFELSGFNVTGSISANGDITGNGVIASTLSASTLSAGDLTVTNDLSTGDIIKGKRLNIGTGNLFVDDGSSTGNAFVKIGAYGSGNFFGKEGSVNGAAFSLGVGTGGKIVEDMKIDTFALSGAGLVNKNTNPVILVPSPGANKYNVPVSIQVYKSQSGSTRVAWGVNAAAISIGVFASSDTTGTFSQLTALPRNVATQLGDWLYNRNQGPDTNSRIFSNRALAFRTSSNITSNSSADVYYLKIRYMVMSEDGDFKSIGNLQIKDS